ncbi:MAG: flagellar hook-length control protein FliK [Sulfurimonas sp.]|jgi:hypothetical protein|nr:flagellar hook-length control protein FliK [Sulfurimonas sp.]
MILLETKSTQKSPAPLDFLKNDLKNDLKGEKRGFSFVELLKGFDLPKEPKEQKEQNTPANETKESSKSIKTALESLLQKSETLQDAQLLHPKLVATMDKTELSALIHKAKEYLKTQIESSPEYKKAQIKELPQTLRGLLEVAKKFGIDVTKISVETQGQEREIQALKTQETPNKKQVNATNKENIAQVHEQQRVQESNEYGEKLAKKVETSQNQKNETLPLFKTAATPVATTEQFVQIKQIQPNSEQKEQKTKTKETLELLLRGEKVEQTNPKLTTDFSVATARVIAPSALQTQEETSRQTRTLESLLQQGEVQTKEQGITPLKADSFEVKLSEAKQMIKYLSSDVKQAIEDYKSPFTRVKIQLNPQRLGEIDLTIVQRGKNLHVNMSSNNTAINTLVANVGELRAQLNNSGINNATLNFNNPSESGNTPGDQGARDQHRDQQRAHQEYEYFAQDESNEEIQSSLEIVVPRYI